MRMFHKKWKHCREVNALEIAWNFRLLNHQTWWTSGSHKRKLQATVGNSPLMESKDAKGQANGLHDAKNSNTFSCWIRQCGLINITCAHGNKQAELVWLVLQPDNASSHSNKHKRSCALLIDAWSAEWGCLLVLKISCVMEAQPMTENRRAYIVNNHVIIFTIAKHTHSCCSACFDSNDSIIFPMLWKWQIPQPMSPDFAISPSEVLQNEPCYRWWELVGRPTMKLTFGFLTTSDFRCWLF
jgi:hypothetical protein